MTDWLLDTLLWTAGLIALVLVLRRPVAKMFGPQIAYALWAIPAVRLILPPLELPAWLNPEPATPSDFSSSTGNSADPLIAPLFENVQPHTPAATLGRLDAAPDQFMPITPLPILEIGMSVWLVGAALFLTYRFAAYFRLRAEMLRDAREVGRYGKIRLLETPEAHAPLAFGVLDPVVALPPGFMAQTDRTARDLALAHELSHHVARDLLANMIVQPLFALHWFNPLGRYGWLAMRRDQEAACDARVMATKPADERAAYASLIASFAAGPKFALAAPMACPVLGEKSIVHRLRSLKLSNMSVRRRIAGRFMVGAALLALPLTASISYAEEQVPEPPAPPAAPLADAAPLPPKPPTPPAPPAPPEAPSLALADTITSIDPGQSTANQEEIEREVELRVERAERRQEEAERRQERAERREERAERREERGERRVVKIRRDLESREQMSDEEIDAIMSEVREGLAEAEAAIAEAQVEIVAARAEMEGQRTIVKMECKGNSDEVAEVIEGQNGGRIVYLCQARVMAHALEGLREARDAIAENREIQGRMRTELLETLDQQISQWERTQQS